MLTNHQCPLWQGCHCQQVGWGGSHLFIFGEMQILAGVLVRLILTLKHSTHLLYSNSCQPSVIKVYVLYSFGLITYTICFNLPSLRVFFSSVFLSVGGCEFHLDFIM